MTGLRFARLQAGYPTAKAAYVAFSKGKKGREALSLAYFVQLESRGPALLSESVGQRLAKLYGCSANLVFSWHAPSPQKGIDDTSGSQISLPKASAKDLGPTKKAQGKSLGPRRGQRAPQKATTTMMILPRSTGGSL
jgi:hypothetical protein